MFFFHDLITENRDVSVDKWYINDLEHDIMKVNEPYSYTLSAQVVLVGGIILNGLEGTGGQHFSLKFLVSHDNMVDDLDLEINVLLGPEQIAELQVFLITT